MMGSVETHGYYFSDTTFEVEVGESGYDCYHAFSWGVHSAYVVYEGGWACDGSGGSPGSPRCLVDGLQTTCPPVVCDFLWWC